MLTKCVSPQLWEDNDSRGIRRTIRVIYVGSAGVVVENTKTGRHTIIALKRFRPNSRGYRLVAQTAEER